MTQTLQKWSRNHRKARIQGMTTQLHLTGNRSICSSMYQVFCAYIFTSLNRFQTMNIIASYQNHRNIPLTTQYYSRTAFWMPAKYVGQLFMFRAHTHDALVFSWKKFVLSVNPISVRCYFPVDSDSGRRWLQVLRCVVSLWHHMGSWLPT